MKNKQTLSHVAILVDIVGLATSFLYLKVRDATQGPLNCKGSAAYCGIDLRELNFLPVAAMILIIFGLVATTLAMIAIKQKQTHAKPALTFSIITIILPALIFLLMSMH